MLSGGSNETVAEALPGTAVILIGESGTVAGVTAADGVDADDDPVELLAVEVNV